MKLLLHGMAQGCCRLELPARNMSMSVISGTTTPFRQAVLTALAKVVQHMCSSFLLCSRAKGVVARRAFLGFLTCDSSSVTQQQDFWLNQYFGLHSNSNQPVNLKNDLFATSNHQHDPSDHAGTKASSNIFLPQTIQQNKMSELL